MIRWRLPSLFVFACLSTTIVALPACDDCGGPVGGEGEGEGEGGEGEGEGEGEPDPEPDPNDPNNANRDSDCDGLTDLEEFGTVYPGGGRTDPGDADSDDDGLPDGLE